jgi:hypothetical protein
MKDHPVEQRALSSYATLRDGDGFLAEEAPRDHDPLQEAKP